MNPKTKLAEYNLTSEIPLIDCLATVFEHEGITYSHWKSNINLGQPAGGEIEFDLLVARRSLTKAMAILAQLGFKAAVARWGPNTPGIWHFFAYDDVADQFIHVHLFGVVLTGESYVKSHLFPFESLLLDNVTYAGSIRTTDKDAETLIFTLRTFVKYGSLPDLLLLRHKCSELKEELNWLQEGSDLARARQLLQRHCPVVEESLFMACVEAIQNDVTLGRRLQLARQIRQRLRGYARHTLWMRWLAYVRLICVELRRRLGKKRKNKTLQSGGVVIAFVGAEATGKSTLVTETARWLGNTFSLQAVHAGKPPATLATAPVSLALPLLRRGLSSLRTNRLDGHANRGNGSHAPRKDNGLPSLVYATRAVILAWERHQLLVGARRAAANGDIVLCDRYPSDSVGAMDSPRLREHSDGGGVLQHISNRLARLEKRIYQQIPPPDIVLRLSVSLETARHRNQTRIKQGKEDDAYVVSRHRQAQEWRKLGTREVHDVDTEHSLAETIRRVKKTIWESL